MVVTKWTAENISTKDIRIAIIGKTTIIQDLEHVRTKFNFSEADMESVPQWNVTPLLGHFGGRVGYCGIL